MTITVWRTGHEIADTVAKALERGLYGVNTTEPISIGYGILRGNEEKIRRCDSNKESWFNVDKGYFKPSHYDGYYRISLKGTQQTIGLDRLKPDYGRLDKLGIEFAEPYRIKPDAHTLIVPPTDFVVNFFKKNMWKTSEGKYFWSDWFPDNPGKILIREKGCERSLDEDLTNCLRVVTFNSSIGWEALRRGIPVYSDPTHSIVGAFQKLIDRPLHLDLDARRELFAKMGALQMTLDEIKSGALCQLLRDLMSLSDGIPEKTLQAT